MIPVNPYSRSIIAVILTDIWVNASQVEEKKY